MKQNKKPGRAAANSLRLYIPRPADGWFYVKMLSDPATMAYNAPWFPSDGCIPEPEAEWETLQAAWIGHAPVRFYAYLQRTSDGAFVGDVNYHWDGDLGRYDMGIVIYAPERGKGYGKQGLRLLLDRAFRIDGVSHLHNDFETTRGAAYHIHKAVGFRETGAENGVAHLELTREAYLRTHEAGEMTYSCKYASPLGGMTMASDGEALTALCFDGRDRGETAPGTELTPAELPVFAQAQTWLDLYFSGRDPGFLPPLKLHGTPFRKAVWDILLTIPYGQTTTYGAIAAQMARQRGVKKMSAQAVGGAVGHNPVSLMVPCHRVIGADGGLTGYGGGLDRKTALLALEKSDTE